MSKNDKKEIKSWNKREPKDKQSKVNKKRKSVNKLFDDGVEKEADDISKMFPHFNVLTEEERLAFFQALKIARKNVEKTGIPIRKCFGTVHDEYLKYFDQNQSHQKKEKKQEENRFIKSDFTLQSNDTNSCSGQSDFIVGQRRAESILSFQDVKETLQESSMPTALEPKNWDGSVIQMETDKIIKLFLKKKKKNGEKGNWLRTDVKIIENGGIERTMKENKWIKQRDLKSLTPNFDALSPEEKEVFFRILQEAHDNVLEKNLNKEYHILPLDAILRRYRGDNEMATHCVFAITQDTLRWGETKKDLKVTVTVTSRDNERLNPQMQADARKDRTENFYSLELQKNNSDEENEYYSQSEETIKRPGNETQDNSFTDFKISEMEVPSDKSSRNSFKSPKISLMNTQIKLSKTEIVNEEENHLKNKKKTKISECQENTQVIELRADSAEKNLIAQEGDRVHLKEKEHGSREELDCWSEAVKTQSDFSAEALRDVCKKIEPKEEVELKLQEREGIPVALEEKMPRKELEKDEKKTEIAMPVRQEDGVLKKVSFLWENSKNDSSEVLKEKNESSEREKRELLKKRNSLKETPGPEAKEYTLNKVMIVSGDVVGKIKRLIWYLEAKAHANTHLEKEYLKLIVDYTAYLSNVLETLILKKDKEEKQRKNMCDAPEFHPCCEVSKKKNEVRPKPAKPEFLFCSMSDPEIKMKQPSVTETSEVEETIQTAPKELETEYDSNLVIQSDSESTGSEEKSRLKYRKDARDRILTMKIRLLQDILRQRAEPAERSFENFKTVDIPEKEITCEEQAPMIELLTLRKTGKQKEKRKRFFKSFLRVFSCGNKKKPQRTG